MLALNWARQHHLLAGSIPSGVHMWTMRASMTPGRWARLVNDAAEVRANAAHGNKCAAVWELLLDRGVAPSLASAVGE